MPLCPSRRSMGTAQRFAAWPREYDRELYQARHLIENFFARLKQYRAIATRYDNLAESFLGAIYLAATGIWLN
ncbi:MAG: transposase [Cyanobacteria bacterium J06638_28]